MKNSIKEIIKLPSGEEIVMIADIAMYDEGSYTVTYKLKRRNPEDYTTIEKNLWIKLIPYNVFLTEEDLKKRINDFKEILSRCANSTELLLKADNYRF